MSTATRARGAGPFNWKVTKSLPGSPVPYIPRKRKPPSPGANRVSYYEFPDSEDGDFEDDDETIVVDHEHHKKRKVTKPGQNNHSADFPPPQVTMEVIELDEDSDEELPLSQLNVAQRSKQLQQPQPNDNSGKQFRDFPLEVCLFKCVHSK